jgi:hypothetical protein
VTFDYEAMENRGRLTWDRMPAGVREMILEAEKLGARVETLDFRLYWRTAPNNATRRICAYRIVNWLAPGAEPEPLTGMSANDSSSLGAKAP